MSWVRDTWTADMATHALHTNLSGADQDSAYLRNPWTGLVQRGTFNTGLGAAAVSSDPRFWLGQLHAVALSLYQAQQRAMDAATAKNGTLALAELGTVKQLRAAFAQVRDKFLAAAEVVDPTALAASDRILLASGTWVDNFLKVLPGALAAPFKVVVEATGQIGAAAGGQLFKVSLPVVATGLLVVFLLLQAERSRTVRAAVAHV